MYENISCMSNDSSVKSIDHLTNNRNWPFKIANKVINCQCFKLDKQMNMCFLQVSTG